MNKNKEKILYINYKKEGIMSQSETTYAL